MRINKKSLQFQNRGKSGFTIMELLIVSILMVIVVMIMNQFWRWFSPCVTDLIAREHLLRESRLTMQNFAYDFGAASEISGGDQLLINNNICYYRKNISDPNLYRRNDSEGTNFAISDCVSDFSVVENPPNSNLWEINVTFQARSYNRDQPFSRELVFHWSPPN